MNQISKYVGLDEHKDTIDVAVADVAGGKPRYFGEIANTPTEVAWIIKALRAPLLIACSLCAI